MEIQPSKPAVTRAHGSTPSETPRSLAAHGDKGEAARTAEDRLELSSRSRRLADLGRELDSPERAERLARIAAELKAGTFNTAERAERSAGSMLE